MSDFREYYKSLQKPSWTPDTSTIGAVWIILYPIIVGVCMYMAFQVNRGSIGALSLFPFGINIILNGMFTPIQMIMRRMGLAALCAWLLLGTTVWCIFVMSSVSLWVAGLYVPYALWVGVASILQTQIWYMNRR